MSPTFLYPLTSFLASILVTALVMPQLLRFCRERGLYDMPNERKVHKNRIPRLGGTLFAPAMTVGMAAAMGVMIVRGDDFLHVTPAACLLFAALFMIFAIGLIDDILGMDAKIKFAVQLAASLFMPLCNLYINNLYGFCGIYAIPVWVGYPLTVFISLLIINSINLIDGIDGLASGLGILCVGAFSALLFRMEMVTYLLFTMGLLGALVVFFFFNMFGKESNDTKTFMGDTGSLILGYSIAYLCIKYAMYNPAVLPVMRCPILVSFTLVIIPVFDLIRVALERLSCGKGIFCPDKRHIHHLFLASGFSMRCSLLCILGFQLLFNVLNGTLFAWCDVSSTVIVAVDVVLYLAVIVWLKRSVNQRSAA